MATKKPTSVKKKKAPEPEAPAEALVEEITETDLPLQPPAAGPVSLIHFPCGNEYRPGPDGVESAKRAGHYHCGFCGGMQPNHGFKWSNGSNFP